MIDAHFHSWQLSRGDYGWLTPDIGAIYRDVTVADWQNLALPLGITGSVLVQAAPTVAETKYLLELSDQHSTVLGVIGWVDFCAADAVLQIQTLALRQKLKGLRPMLHDLPDPAWILQPAVQPALAEMQRLGLVLDALIRPAHLTHICEVTKNYPDLSVVIDHCAKPNIANKNEATWQTWADGMAILAAFSNVSCKLSGLLTEAGELPKFNNCKPYINHVVKLFGAERVMWGSDWPVLELAGNYQQWFKDCLNHGQSLTASQQANIFTVNAKRIYKL